MTRVARSFDRDSATVSLVSPETSSTELLLRTLSLSTAFQARGLTSLAPPIKAAAIEIPALAVLFFSLVSWLKGALLPGPFVDMSARQGRIVTGTPMRSAFGKQKPETFPYPFDEGLLAVRREPIGSVVAHSWQSTPKRLTDNPSRGFHG